MIDDAIRDKLKEAAELANVPADSVGLFIEAASKMLEIAVDPDASGRRQLEIIVDTATGKLGEKPGHPIIELPDKAPELWDHRKDIGENPVDFVNRVWGAYYKNEDLYPGYIFTRDKGIKNAIYYHCKKHDINPRDVLPPTKKERNDNLIGSGSIKPRDALRVGWAIERRARIV